MNEYGICAGCDKLYELREERKIFDGKVTYWLCPRCHAVTDDSIMEKKKEWEISIE